MKEPGDRASDTHILPPWWDDAAQCRTFDLIRRLIEILVPFNLGTELLTPTSFLPWWDDAAQRRTFDLIRRLIEILVPFTTIRRHDPAHDRTGAHHSDKRLIGISPTESLETRRRRRSAASWE